MHDLFFSVPTIRPMITPDESILSAYLDGELDARRARMVEHAIAADPSVAEKVAGLRAVQAAVSGLSRPAGPDLSARVMARIDRAPVALKLRGWLRSRRVILGAGG